jgi:hypothetical protein
MGIASQKRIKINTDNPVRDKAKSVLITISIQNQQLCTYLDTQINKDKFHKLYKKSIALNKNKIHTGRAAS